jgi:NAD+ synthase (glutamine-hydrolysing)
MSELRVGLAQINPTVGDIQGNASKILAWIEKGRAQGCDLLAFPELVITGYPPEDLLFKPAFIEANLRALDEIARASGGITLVVGFVDKSDDVFNAAAIAHDGRLAGIYHKQYLPNYGVFDENRYFRAGSRTPVFSLGERVVGVNICEDIWYPAGPATAQAQAGAQVIITINASPYHAGKVGQREKMLATRAAADVCYMAYVNMVGGQDELIFDGQSMIVNQAGELMARGKAFQEELVVADLDCEAVLRSPLRDPRRRKATPAREPIESIPLDPLPPRQKPRLPPAQVSKVDEIEEIYEALKLGTRDYVRKNGFTRVVIGLSGGVDSALVAAIAVDALGPENVVGVSMPSPYSSEGTKRDARRVATLLGIEFLRLPITPPFRAILRTLAKPFKGLKEDAAEENIQARVRGMLLMALSNKFGWLVLTTGNKSELAVGYCTLYGDMAGGFAVIKDVPKTLVYRLARYRNRRGPRPVIPESILTRAPSAELRPDQTDQDSLPPYETLDPILEAYVGQDKGLRELVADGFKEETVKKVIRMVDRNEYKRRQGPIGIKITPRAFGKDWRFPIVNRFREE